jgi:hypothetical protein
MPSKTHESAQRKVWKAELKTLASQARKIRRDFAAARRPLLIAATKANAALAAFDKRKALQQPRALSAIDRRRGILVGKLGL